MLTCFGYFVYAYKMQCPYCSGQTQVTNSRSHNKSPLVWRRRQCKNCGSIWTTREYIDLSTSHRVLNRHKHLQDFSRDILFLSIKDSLSHRKDAVRDAGALTDTVLSRVLAQKQITIKTTTIIEVTREVLYRFDRTAAAVYRAKNL